jgi:hypothetical protein
VTRAIFQELARIRIEDAKVLLDAGRSDAAYYLAGYAVECALKACIAKLTSQYDFPPKPRVVESYYRHDLQGLLKAAGLDAQLDLDAPRGSTRDANVGIVYKWNEQIRYARIEHREASRLIQRDC